MKHLVPYSVYQDPRGISELLSGIDCDGMELLTGYYPVDPVFKEHTVSVHLPYTTDWLAAWEGRAHDITGDNVRYYMYGKDREEIIANIRVMIDRAAPLNPVHGVIHASNIDLFDVMKHNYSRNSDSVLRTFADVMNSAVSCIPGGEPPFKLVFENLWWPGLRLKDDSDFKILEDKLEFENWGICLDTGHLMNCLPDIDEESDGIEALMKVFDGYSQDLIDSISAMHLHYSASGTYRKTFHEAEFAGDFERFITAAYSHVSKIDQHLPFSDPRCKDLVDRINPDIVVHELPGNLSSPRDDYTQQRKLLG